MKFLLFDRLELRQSIATTMLMSPTPTKFGFLRAGNDQHGTAHHRIDFTPADTNVSQHAIIHAGKFRSVATCPQFRV